MFRSTPIANRKKSKKILSKYRHEPACDGLKRKIYNDLSAAKAAGEISIPSKVVMRKSPSERHLDFIEVILDTKV